MTRIFRNLDVKAFGRLTSRSEKRLKKHGGREIAADAIELVESARAFYSGVYPSEAPYFFWGAGLYLPWAVRTLEKFETRVFDDLEFRRITNEIVRIGTHDSDGRPCIAVTYLSGRLCSTQKGKIQGLAVETMIAVDEYLEYLSAGRLLEAIPWLSAAYADLIEATCQCWQIFGNAQQRARAGGIEKHRRDPKQAEKNFVRACYVKWRASPSRYKSKAAFARDMLAKCEHLESQKKIEDWVRGWDHERSNTGTMLPE